MSLYLAKRLQIVPQPAVVIPCCMRTIPESEAHFWAVKLHGVKKRPDFMKETHKNKGGPDTLSHMFNELSLFGK